MCDEPLLLLGLNGLARAHELDYFADGHRAAALRNALGQREPLEEFFLVDVELHLSSALRALSSRFLS